MTEQEPAAPARKLSTRAIAIVVAIALVVLAGVGTGIYFLTKDDTPAASGAAPAGGQPTDPPSGSSGATPTGPGSTGAGATPAEVSSVKVVAEKAIAAINSHDPAQLKLVSCDPEAIGPVEGAPPEAKAELVSTPELTGDTATVEVKLTIGEQSTTTPLPLRKQNGTWCVD
jgi:flagellar basal body-associated protein FliL